MNLKLKTFLVIFLITYLIVRIPQEISKQTASKSLSNKDVNVQKVIKTEPVEQKIIYPSLQNITNDISFTVSAPKVFNGKTRAEIYDLRKKAVADSPFFAQNYEPSNEVFGSIVDGKPWYGANSRPCSVKNSNVQEVIKGDTLLSPIVLNPNALVSIFSIACHTKLDLNSSFCKAHHNYIFTPTGVNYKAKENTLEIRYRLNDTLTGNNVYKKKHDLQITGINARDAGFEYVTATNFTGGYFFNQVYVGGQLVKNYNVTQGVYKFQDFIHLGGSCGVEGGCNNISPRQTYLEFGLSSFPAQMDLKLWRSKPKSPNATADLNCKIIFE